MGCYVGFQGRDFCVIFQIYFGSFYLHSLMISQQLQHLSQPYCFQERQFSNYLGRLLYHVLPGDVSWSIFKRCSLEIRTLVIIYIPPIFFCYNFKKCFWLSHSLKILPMYECFVIYFSFYISQHCIATNKGFRSCKWSFAHLSKCLVLSFYT